MFSTISADWIEDNTSPQTTCSSAFLDYHDYTNITTNFENAIARDHTK